MNFFGIIIGLLIISLITGFAMVGFSDYQQQRALTLYAKALYHDLKWARIKAVMLNQSVTVQPNNYTNWCHGWVINSEYQQAQHEIKYQAAINGNAVNNDPNDCRIVFKSFPSNRNYFRFSPEGYADYQNGSYYFYQANQLRAKIIISQMGRVRFEQL